MNISQAVSEYLQGCDIHRIRRADVASHLGFSDGCLSSHLLDEDTNYTTLLSAERKRRTVNLLARNPHANAPLIAKICGYRRAESALRSFHHWFGCGIREYKSNA